MTNGVLLSASDTVLNEAPGRAFKFLGAVSARASIRAMLASYGYSEADHQRGWSLTLATSGYRPAEAAAPTTPAAAAALAAIDAWDEPTFRIARASLGAFPAQLDFVFAGLEAQTGAAAVASVTVFLNRLDELESGKGRKATHKDDLAALAKLSARGITVEERARMRGLLSVALASEPVVVGEVDAGASAKAAKEAEAERAAKLELYQWYAEWSEIARVVVKRRDYLIQLGLASRMSKAERDEAAAKRAKRKAAAAQTNQK
jgi:hypothetical protein